jgi:signal transduction histidine kinase
LPAPEGRANPLWAAAALLSALLALAVGGWTVVDQYLRSRPVGEGELFVAEAGSAVADYQRWVAEGVAPSEAVRRIRNHLQVESVSVVDGDGDYLYSTSDNQVGSRLGGYLGTGLQRRVFAAIAEPLPRAVLVDGVVEWEEGDILYRVFSPLEQGGLLIEYDISALLARRASQAALRPAHLVAGAASILLLTGTALLLIARQGARRRATAAALEKRYLEQRSRELVEYNRELDQARAEAVRALTLAEETNRIRSEFVLMINHELRTPLTSIVTGSELLASRWDDLGPEEVGSLLEAVVADGRRLKELITQMLVVARIENRGLRYELRRVEVGSLRARLSELSPRTGLWPSAREVPPIMTDVETLSHLLVSLADNARTHGASRVEIGLADGLPFDPVAEVGRRPRSGLYFLVSDDGPGIDPGFAGRMFEKFEKRGRSSGTGLGLYLAKLMVEGIEGSISVATSQEGTVMAVGVPCSVVERMQVAV